MYVNLKPVSRRSHLEAAQTRYAIQIEELESLGFEDVCIYYDYAPPYYFFESLFFTLFLKYLVRDTWAMVSSVTSRLRRSVQSSLATHWNRHLNWVRIYQEEVPIPEPSLEDFKRLSLKELRALHPDHP